MKESHDYNFISNVDILETQLQLFNVPQHFHLGLKEILSRALASERVLVPFPDSIDNL